MTGTHTRLTHSLYCKVREDK